jgi:hypothetical protein
VKYPNECICPILVSAEDYAPPGRCLNFCDGDVCPRHGDVSAPLALYRETGKLTDERDLSPRKTTR